MVFNATYYSKLHNVIINYIECNIIPGRTVIYVPIMFKQPIQVLLVKLELMNKKLLHRILPNSK